MALSVASSPVDFPGGLRISAGTITFDSSYPTGGEAITPAQWGASAVGCDGRQPDHVLLDQTGPTAKHVVPTWVKSTGKILAFGTAAGADGITEVANAQSLATTTVNFLAFWVNPGATVTTV